MKQDFALPGTPAFARKLVYLSKFADVEVDDKIRELANQNLFTNRASTRLSSAAIQFIIDCDMRAAIPYYAGTNKAIIREAICAHGGGSVVVATVGEAGWWAELKSCTTDLLIDTPQNVYKLLDDPHQSRDRILILDWINRGGPDVSLRRALALEFPKTIIYEAQRRQQWPSVDVHHTRARPTTTVDYWLEQAGCLFPAMPTDFLQTIEFKLEMTQDGNEWKTKHPDALAVLYNVFIPYYHLDFVADPL